MMYSAYELNKQNDNIQHWHTSVPILNLSVVPCPVLIVSSWPAYKFHRRQVRCWYSHLLKNCPVCCIPHKGFGIVNKAKVDVFMEVSCIFNGPADVGNLIAGSSAFSKSILNILKFIVHILLKPGLKNFEHYLARVWDEWNCTLVCTFFDFAFFGTGMKTDLFQSCGHCWVFQIF